MPDRIVCSDPAHLVGSPEIAAYGLVLVVGQDAAVRSATLRRLLTTLPGDVHAIVLDPSGTLGDPSSELPAHWSHAKDPAMARAQGLRAALRQDPDVIAVDLVESKDEVSLLVNAALTGHLVFAGVAAPSFEAARERLTTLVEPFLFDSAGARLVAAASDAHFASGPRQPPPPRPEPTLEERYALGERARPTRARSLLETLRTALEPHRRLAFRPVLGPEGEERNDSKFGGRPWLRPGEERPVRDGVPLFLALQLDLSSLPEAARAVLGDGGHLQVFRALEGDDDGSPFGAATKVRVLPALATVALAPEVVIPGARWKPRSITGWEPFDDFPHPEDWRELGIGLSDDDQIGLELVRRFTEEHVEAIARGDELGRRLVEVVRKDWDHFRLTATELRQARRYGRAALGDKLLGWPSWEQGPEWPTLDGERMQYLLQLEFDDRFAAALPGLVASDGRMHLFRSAKAPERFAAPWACG